MKPKISIITLGVSDLKRSLKFYREGLGFPTHEYKDDAGIVFFKLEGTWLALYPKDELFKDLGDDLTKAGLLDEQESKTLPLPRGGLGGVGQGPELEKNLLSPHGERTKVRGGVMDNLPSVPSLVRRGSLAPENLQVTLAHNVGTKEEVDAVVQLAVDSGATLVKQAARCVLGRVFRLLR